MILRHWCVIVTMGLLGAAARPLQAQHASRSAAEPAPAETERPSSDFSPPATEASSSGRSRPLTRVRFENRPSLRFGDALRLDLVVKLQGDVRDVSSGSGAETLGVGQPGAPAYRGGAGPDSGFDWRRRRIGVHGVMWKRLEFEVEREIDSDRPWRDALLDVRVSRSLQLRAGQFKMPFSLEQLTSASDLDFVDRSRIADTLAPGRSVGASIHGRVAGRLLSYDVGVFQRDGEAARFKDNPGAGRTLGGRVTMSTRRRSRRSRTIADFEAAANVTTGEVPEGRHSLRGRLTSDGEFFSPIFVSGRRLRLGADLRWRPGPVSIVAEVIRVDDQRVEQGLMGETLPPVRAEGWYVGGTWAVMGLHRGPTEGAIAWRAVELAARIEQLEFGSASSAAGATQFRNPRAAQLKSAGLRAWTIGSNWRPSRWTTVQFNIVRESLSDPGRSPVPGTSIFWTNVCRLQFAM